MNRKGVAERFAALGFGCDVWTDPPGQVWADFVHDVDEIVMLVEGEIEVSDAPRRAGRGQRDPGRHELHRQEHLKDHEPLVLRLSLGITDGVTTVRGTGVTRR